jgi:hypothetical protein
LGHLDPKLAFLLAKLKVLTFSQDADLKILGAIAQLIEKGWFFLFFFKTVTFYL